MSDYELKKLKYFITDFKGLINNASLFKIAQVALGPKVNLSSVQVAGFLISVANLRNNFDELAYFAFAPLGQLCVCSQPGQYSNSVPLINTSIDFSLDTPIDAICNYLELTVRDYLQQHIEGYYIGRDTKYYTQKLLENTGVYMGSDYLSHWGLLKSPSPRFSFSEWRNNAQV